MWVSLSGRSASKNVNAFNHRYGKNDWKESQATQSPQVDRILINRYGMVYSNESSLRICWCYPHLQGLSNE